MNRRVQKDDGTPKALGAGDVVSPFDAHYSGFNAQGQSRTFTYDPQTFRTQTVKTVTGSTVLQDLSFVFDAGGNLTALTDALHGDQIFTYDALDRLTSGSGLYGTKSYTCSCSGSWGKPPPSSYQASPLKSQIVLSVVSLGRRLLSRTPGVITIRELPQALARLHRHLAHSNEG